MPTAREVISFLKRKGVVLKRQSGSHAVMKHPEKKIRVVIPVHSGDLPKGLFHRILKDAGYTLEDFRKEE